MNIEHYKIEKWEAFKNSGFSVFSKKCKKGLAEAQQRV